MKKLTRFLTALLLTFALFAHAEMVDTYAFKNQADRTRAVELAKSLRCPQWARLLKFPSREGVLVGNSHTNFPKH